MNCHYNGLSLIQSLGRHGVSVIAVDSKRSIGTRSRYSRYMQVPEPSLDREGFIDALIQFGNTLPNKALVIPTNDHWAEALAWGYERLGNHYHLCVADFDTVKLLLDKESFGQWALNHDIQVPDLWSAEQALDLAADLPYPVAIKANARRRSGQHRDGAQWSRIADKFRFLVCTNKHELMAVINQARSAEVPVFCQQIVNGRSDSMRTIGIYARQGQVYGLVYGRKDRGFPARYGDCIVGIAEPVPNWARDLAARCCSLLDYTGIAEIEVMVDAETGARFLIEINPRSWSWVGVGPVAGVDLAWIAYQDMVQDIRPEKTIEGCADGKPVYYAKALADFQNSVLWYRFSSAPEWALSPLAWWKTFHGKKGVFAEFAKDDPAVALFSMVAAIRQFLGNSYKVMRGGRFE